MKKFVILLLGVMVFGTIGLAQQTMPVPFDPNVRTGQLENGLTYFIRHNEKPAQRANFYIAQKVGSILEEENQRGLAHFLEHMAFNGTKNFPGKNLLDYMERNGVKFGENVNAWTGIEQTVYMLTNVPTTSTNLVDSCLLILHDWSSFISLEGEEIDKERGVILEEMRQRETSQMRIYEKMLPEIYPNSPYGHRLPIGTEEVVAHFDHQALRDYYHKWYRPDLQGIIIVGDIDVDQIENRIKTLFADIQTPVNPAERTRFAVTDNDTPIVSICTDIEETHYTVNVYYKHDVVPAQEKNDMQYWMKTFIDMLVSTMFNNRLEELTQKANPPFIYGSGYYSTFFVSDTKEAWSCTAIAKDCGGINEAMTAIVTECNKMRRFGFTQSEFERAKADLLKSMENRYEERNKQENGTYFWPLLSHFLNNEPLMGIENEFALLSQALPNIPLEVINQYAPQFVTDSNIVITLKAPIKEDEELPTKDMLLDMFDKANALEVEAYKETVSNEPLVANLPAPGKITQKTSDPEFDATVLTLDNGIKVIYKPTTFKDDEILMSAFSMGGISVLPQDELSTLKEVNSLITLGGVGNFSAIDLSKVTMGKKANVRPGINNYSESMSGNCSAKDLETMMQLTYLYFTAPRSDQEAYQSYITRTKAALANIEANPMITFRDSLTAVLYGNHPLAVRMKSEDYDKVNYDMAMHIYGDRFADPNNFIFTFVGNIDPATFEPMIEQYLGSLPATSRNETWKDNGMNITEKNIICHYEKEMETPKATCYMVYNGKMEYTLENQIYMNVFTDIMDIVYTEKIREDEGGTYGVGVNGSVSNRPDDYFVLLVGFETNKDMYEKLMGIAKAELENIAEVGPRPQDLKKVKEFMLKNHAEKMERNGYWMNAIESNQRDGINPMKDYESILNGISIESMAQFGKRLISAYKKEIVQLPK